MWAYNYLYPFALYHHGIKGQQWGVRRTPEQLGHPSKTVDKPPISDIMKSVDTSTPKAKNHNGKKTNNIEIFDPQTGEYYHLAEGTRIQNPTVFAGKGGVKPLQEETAYGLAEQIGGTPQNWQHSKGAGLVDFYGEEREAEIHWFQEKSVGKHRYRIKEWME